MDDLFEHHVLRLAEIHINADCLVHIQQTVRHLRHRRRHTPVAQDKHAYLRFLLHICMGERIEVHRQHADLLGRQLQLQLLPKIARQNAGDLILALIARADIVHVERQLPVDAATYPIRKGAEVNRQEIAKFLLQLREIEARLFHRLAHGTHHAGIHHRAQILHRLAHCLPR